MPWYPSAKACPAAIKPTVQCFFPTLYQVLLFDFSSFGEKLFFCLRGYAAQSREARCKNSRSAERGCSSVHPPPNRRRMGGGSNLAPHQQAIAAQSREARCKNSRSAERCARRRVSERNRRRRHLAQSEDVPLFTRRRTGGEWVKEITWLYCWGEQQTPHHRQQAIATPRKVGT